MAPAEGNALTHGALAQLGERRLENPEVRGSSPLRSTTGSVQKLNEAASPALPVGDSSQRLAVWRELENATSFLWTIPQLYQKWSRGTPQLDQSYTSGIDCESESTVHRVGCSLALGVEQVGVHVERRPDLRVA